MMRPGPALMITIGRPDRRLVDIVGDEQDGDADLRPHVEQHTLHPRPHWASSAPNGSSISSTRGLLASARAMPTRCCMPPESVWKSRQGGKAHAANNRRPMRSASAAPRPASSGPRLTFSITVFQGNNVGSWNTTPRSAPRRGDRLAVDVRLPLSADEPASAFSKVDLPQPDGPSTQTNSPGATSRLTG